MNREQALAALADQEFDLVIIGAGITGAMLAFDAAHRGMRVAVVEKGDFGGATSAASSKVLHGGIRFLRQFRLDKVRESSLERIRIRNLVPHLCADLPFVIPTYRKLGNDRLTLSIARLIYETMATGQNKLVNEGIRPIAKSALIGRTELFDRASWLSGNDEITGGLLLPEIHMLSSERVTWTMLDKARDQGAVIANYLGATGLVKHGAKVAGVTVADKLSGDVFDVRGQIVANCAGPWIESFGQPESGKSTITAFCRGAHLVADLGHHDCAVALPTSEKIDGVAGVGGRNMFLIPWRGQTLVGTSYSRHDGSPDDVVPSVGDVRQLLEGVNGAIGRDLITPDNITHSYAGLYPLTAINVDTDRYQGATDYRLLDHATTEGIGGYISVFGAKFTTSRLLAEKAADLAVKKIGKTFRPCQSRLTTADRHIEESPSVLVDSLRNGRDTAHRDELIATASLFGGRASEVLQIAAERAEFSKPLARGCDVVASAAVFAARNESVVHLEDFVLRRTGLGTLGHPGAEALEFSARLVGDELGWTKDRRDAEIARVEQRFPDRAMYRSATEGGTRA